MKEIRSVSFDTSFLLSRKTGVDQVLKIIKHDQIKCYLTSTVISELEQLKVWDRIDEQMFKLAWSRWQHLGGSVINFKNRTLSTEINKYCTDSMEFYHGVSEKNIINDCNIIVNSLKNGVDLFLSEDYHFTSKITLQVLDEITNKACKEYYQMCDEEMFSIDTDIFLAAYNDGKIDIDIVESKRKSIIKPEKTLKGRNGH